VNFRYFLAIVAERNASDIYFTEESPPMYRIEGIVQPIGEPVFTAGISKAWPNPL
jgi:Tfp pilus assembly ATPase PilU